MIDLGPHATEMFDTLGLDPARAAKARRRFGFACLDWTERRAHLGGALGAELLRRCLDAGWFIRAEGTRALIPTARGRRALQRILGAS